MNVCLICEASLNHQTLYIGNLVSALAQKKNNNKKLQKKKNYKKKRVTAPILKPTYDQTFFGQNKTKQNKTNN